ncbi:MAG TPA: carboxypeptidase regulatory-like domain-containing protein, partial [Telluria sp.]|nr:carboxypeptidase regulatory-like domain-containing protein [Telluria sp.]
MPKFPIAGRLAALASAILLSLAGCGGGSTPSPESTPTPPPSTLGTVRGVVADAQSGAPLAGVEVKIGALSASSDANGAYAISGVPTAGAVVAQFSKAQYASNFATVAVNQDRTSVANRSLAKVAIVQNIDAALGATVTLSGSPAQVQLPAAGLVDAASGASYTGAATVAMTPIDARLQPLTMPGNYRAEGEPAPIESMGALQVEIRSANGALLNLAPGKRATIRIPVPAGSTSPPLTMPLYYFKETSGLWVREGMATLAGNPPQQYYEGTVAHFSTWNADQPFDTLMINGCVVDGQQKPLAATVTSSGIDYNGSASVQTLADGTFKVPARRNSQVLVTAEDGSFSASVTVTTGITDLTLPACLVIDPQLPVILSQPRSITVAPGTFATLDVVASNATQYTWYHNGTLIASGARVLPLVGGAGTEGSYYVEVSNRLGKVASSTVTVTVGAAA